MNTRAGADPAEVSTEPELRSAGQAVARLTRQLEHGLASVELSVAQYRILGLLIEGWTVSANLAQQLAVTAASITAVVDGLVARGLVRRGADPEDRRRSPVLVTPKGFALLQQAEAAVDDRLNVVAEHLAGGADGAAAVADLRRWHLALDGLRDEHFAVE